VAELVMPAVVAPSTPVGRASPRKSQASTPPLLQSRAAAEKVAQLSSELKLSSELVEKLQALSSELAEKLAAVTVEKSAAREELAAAHAELVHDAGLEARCVRLESEMGAVLEGRHEAQEELVAAKSQLRQMAEALQEAHAMLGGERERAERGEAEAAALGGRLREAVAERDEALRARVVAEAEKLTAEAVAAQAASQAQALQAQLQALQAQAQALQAQVQAQVKTLRAETRAEMRALQAERSSVLDRAEQAEGHGAEVALRLRALLEEQAGTRQQLAVGQAERCRLQEAMQHTAARVEEVLGELGEAKEQRCAAERRCSELAAQCTQLEEELAGRRRAAGLEAEERRRAHDELAAVHAERDRLEARLVRLEARCVRLESEMGAVLEGRHEAQEELVAVRAAAQAAGVEAQVELVAVKAEAQAAGAEAQEGAKEAARLRAQLRQMAEALQEAHAMLGGERERAERGEAEAAALGGRLREAVAERDEALRARVVAEAEKLTAEAEVCAAEESGRLAASVQQEARLEAELGWTAAQGRGREAAARVAELETLRAAAEEARGALEEERGALQSQLDSVTAEKRGAEQREALAHERARVVERQRQILLRLSSGKHQAQAVQQTQVQLRHDLGVGGRPGGAAAPCTPATGVVSRPSPLPSLSPSPSWREGKVHHEQ
jgi:hypothetical protein